MGKIESFGVTISAYPDYDSGLVYVGKEGSQGSIPEGKDGAVIGIAFPNNHRMVDSVHGRGHKKNPKKGFEPFGDPQAAVMKLGAEDYGAFKYEYAERARTQKEYDGYLYDGGDG